MPCPTSSVRRIYIYIYDVSSSMSAFTCALPFLHSVPLPPSLLSCLHNPLLYDSFILSAF